MDIKNITKEEYKKIVINPFSKFDTVEFVELNKSKVDEVVYFIFNNGKNRFGLAGGIKDETLKFPFSATFSCFSNITSNNRISHYMEAVQALNYWAAENNIKKIQFNTPPTFYDNTHITKLQNALINNNYKIENYDINYEYYLEDFDDNYINKLSYDARRNYKISVKNCLSFEKTDNIEEMYRIIKLNREHKGYPLWMAIEDIKKTSEIIPSDYFLVKHNEQTIASAFIHNINNNVIRVVYWGNIPNSEKLCPMNFLAYNIFAYYKQKSKIIVDIGTSTLNSYPNYGLCDFKQSIGCKCSPKLNFYKEL